MDRQSLDDPSASAYRHRGYYPSNRDETYRYRGRGYYHPSRGGRGGYGYPQRYHPSPEYRRGYGYPRHYHPSRHDPYAHGYRPYFGGHGLDSNNGSQGEGSVDDGAEEDTEELGSNGSQSEERSTDDGDEEEDTQDLGSDGSQSESTGAAADNKPLNPPLYGYPNDAGNLPRPEFVLMEPYAYFADRANATTACCETSRLGALGTIKVTFCAARPPLVSDLCVHATAFDHTKFAVEPHIVATETDGGLVLLCLVISDRQQRHYFIYDARGPSLRHLPRHSCVLDDHSFAIVRSCGVRCGQGDHDCGDYVIAAHGNFRFVHPVLCLYHSDTNTWSEQSPVMLKKYPSHSHVTSKTITVGGDGGTVAWVDLRHDILYCNVLEERPKLRVVPLPPQNVRPFSRADINPRSVRDVAFVGGFLKYVEMESRVEPGLPRGSSRAMHSWKAAIWSIKTSRKSRWHKDCELESSDISEPLPELRITPQPTLSTLHMSLPTLSLQDDGVVYFLAKNGRRDKNHTTWVIAVDTRNKTVQKMDAFNASRTADLATGYYDASRISKYLKAAPV